MSRSAGCRWTFFRLAKQATNNLNKAMSKSENMDNFTVLYTSYLHFTFCSNLMHTFPHAYGIFVFLSLSSTNLCYSNFSSKTIDHVQIVWASQGPLEARTCRSNSTFNRFIWVCQLDFEKFDRYDFSQTKMFTCILKVQFQWDQHSKSIFSDFM